MLNQPRVAEFIEAELRKSAGIVAARANPVTGRLLLHHDPALRGERIAQLIRRAVAPVVRKAGAIARPPGTRPGVMPAWNHRHRSASAPFAFASGAAVAVLAPGRGRLLHRPALVRLGATVTATVLVIRRGWRRYSRSRRPSTVSPGPASPGSAQHPLLRIVGARKRRLYLASFCSVLGHVLEILPSLLMGGIASVLLTGESTVLMRLGLASASSQLWFLAGAAALACAALAGMSFISGVLWRDLAQSVQHEWRTEMYAHVQRVKLGYLEGERATRLARVLTDDIDQLGRFFASSANSLVQLGASFVIFVPMFLFLAPSFAWIAFLPAPVIAWLSFYYQEHMAPEYAISGERAALLNSQLINNLEASGTVKSFGAEAYEIDRIYHLSEASRQSNHRIDSHSTAYTEGVRMCASVSFVGVLLLGGREVLSGALPFEVFNSLAGLPHMFLGRLPGLGNAVDQYHRTVAALDRVQHLRGLPIEPDDGGRRLDAAEIQGEMVLDGVTFAYPGRPPVLRDLSMRIAPGRTTGIVGVTGSGKTTIAKLLMRLEDVTSGQVLLDGVDIRDLRLQDLRSAIGFVGQDAFLFDGTVGENIRYGSFDASPEQVARAARVAEADDFVEALPARYDTTIGERGVMLSGGQKQRIALARAILKSAPIVILDEATSAVDNETEAAIQRALADFARDRTMVIIAHRLSTIRHADWIYVLGEGGRVVEAGTHQELLDYGGVYASLWHLQIAEVSS
jgi:ATP-binding cassette, subfamily B, bacterial